MRTLAAWMLPLSAALVASLWTMADDPPPKTGPATEKRFPPLQVPPGFKATLFACDPLIEYPSVIAAGPKANQLFVAIDYVTGLGVEIVRRDEIRLIEDTNSDGYADKAIAFAGGFNSIQGLTYHDGAVYVMHAPFLTVLRDTDGDGKADERRDLLTGLGLKPEDNPSRLHCANGVVVGHDGWLYLALGDNGCNVLRPEGDRLIFNGGGILRCRPDGRDLHIFATGLRNIYDVALDEELNVFVRDNENDGGTYMIRVCHSFFGADHGYPYLYYERPDEALPPLADMGLGSSAGVVCYLETAFPKEFRGNLFGCEWGRSLVRYELNRSGSGFAPVKEIEFAAGAPKDPYGFKPTDVVVQRDGAMMVSDWCDGQRPKRGRGRIYRITPAEAIPMSKMAKQGADIGSWIAQLNSESYYSRLDAQSALERVFDKALRPLGVAIKDDKFGPRGRMHAIWILATTVGLLVSDLSTIAKSDSDARVRAQAVRALVDLSDPVLVHHRLAAGRSDAVTAEWLAIHGLDQEPRVVLEIVIGLGRLRWAGAPAWLSKNLMECDATLAHAAQQTLRRCDNWPAVLKLLDLPNTAPIRAIALRAVADQADAVIVDGLIERLGKEKDSARRREYADALTRVANKPGPWKYWGYRPPPRTPNTVAWERTEAIEKALDQTLGDPDRAVRFAVLQRMQREKIPTRLAALSTWLTDETDSARVAAVLSSLRDHPASAIREPLEALIMEKKQTPANRQAALALLDTGLGEAGAPQLLTLAGALEDGPVMADALRQLGKYSKVQSQPLILSKLKAAHADVRAAAAEAAGKLGLRQAVESLLVLAKEKNVGIRGAALDSLRRLKEPRVVPFAVAALIDHDTRIVALQCLRDLGHISHAKIVADIARHDPSAEVLTLAAAFFSAQMSETEGLGLAFAGTNLREMQGGTGILVHWQVFGPLDAKAAPKLTERLPDDDIDIYGASWHSAIGTGIDSRVQLGSTKTQNADAVWLAHTWFSIPGSSGEVPVQFLTSSNGPIKIWLNGRLAFHRAEKRSYVADVDRFDTVAQKGNNHLLVQISPGKTNPEFHLRFRRKSSTANHEELMQAALAKTGNAERGRKLFQDVAKTQCLKCHRLGEQGEKIGPDLTGVGNRFARVYLIESILEPNRTIAPSYETLQVEMKDGRVIAGVRIAETAEALTLGDTKGDKHVLPRNKIDSVRPLPTSTMPDGLERSLSADDFVDLIAFLTSLK